MDAASLQPQPGLDQLRPLIDRVAAAGLPVELRISGSPRVLPPGLDLAAYRVVQEALTNVMKHTRHAKTMVRLDYGPEELVIEVTDDGPPVTAAANRGAVPAPADAGTGTGTGRGLLGLRERVALYGGEFDAGQRPGGGWRVRARLRDNPLPTGPAQLAAPQR